VRSWASYRNEEYWNKWEVRRENSLCGERRECYIAPGLLPNPFSLLCHVGYLRCAGLCPYISGRVGGDKPARYNEALNMFSACTCVIQVAFYQEMEDVLQIYRRMVAGKREIQGKFQKGPLDLLRHT